ncbi:DUF6572 domain-containing protein [Aliikangiella sp. IMCC44359]|uniref:DUF6572 domain-containing protein n=1 Tax=Aliikangiella sp. IMCC44359 TaxID=3459125 RepID=UPI00403B0D45
MSIEESNKIDIINTDNSTNEVVLTITDHLDWGDVESHLLKLQEKVNNYLAFIESGEIYDAYPNAIDRKKVIQVLYKYVLVQEAIDFYNVVSNIVEEAGISFQYIHSPD